MESRSVKVRTLSIATSVLLLVVLVLVNGVFARTSARLDLTEENRYTLNDGSRVGLYVGGGLHVFLNNWIALDLTVRDYLFSDNPSGLDFDADLAVEEEDARFLNHLFMGVGVSLFFPMQAKRTR